MAAGKAAKGATKDAWAGDGSGSGVRGDTLWEQVAALIGTILLITTTPPSATFIVYICTKLHGSSWALVEGFRSDGLAFATRVLNECWPSAEAWKVIVAFGAFEAFLQLYLPGKEFKGPVTVRGNVPVYTANGVQSYVVTLLALAALSYTGVYNPARVTDLICEIITALSMFAYGFCFFLLVKGHVAPSTSDSGSSGNWLHDFYWGMELYPRIGKHFDIKQFTNCRFGMMGWAVLIMCYAAKQVERDGALADSTLVSVLLSQIYIAKFFWWETGYFGSIDIMYDRAGYYICWGCLVWVPSLYTSPVLYVAQQHVVLGPALAGAIFLAGVTCIWINFDADRQRQDFRASQGKMLIWGKPGGKIVAKYTTSAGEQKESLLLTSGWWGITRHFHYLPEISAAFFWSLPGLFNHVAGYFYVIFLTFLLADRAVRDDRRCRGKYGKYWEEYCKRVPYKMLPYIF
mmetsp:Transcript_9033/g.29660  ORF Transcript_9033/g.29660 Transcript_9033/m.29660 type:complete len:459 (-) Transcript_9033:123-1499(-)|eukprot:CAMPEP_0170143786 /NCGR_PEP_ID=MMETSP0033_2-20121228/13063_1 /TAXON_ID=195969 /ORGANISM="Dolichomastix tenuilepis, Strain CCMP3274" /LENGTH=458 /DNA_ID=CAMNT_0010380257 /DNA_START=125 /DNA_END=1501 /DNA_ORIENTATION=+